MTGFDDLERQLRGKVTASAPRRRWPLVRTLAATAAVLSCAGAAAAAATGVIGGPGAGERAASLLDDVSKATSDVPACRPHGPRPALLSSLPASDLALQAFPQLRRPPTARERALGRKYGRLAGQKRVLSGGARELRATDGKRFVLIVNAGRERGLGRGPDCLPVLREELERRAPDADPQAVAIARSSLDEQERGYRTNLGRERLIIAQLRPNGRLAGFSGTYLDVAVREGTGSSGFTRVDGEKRLVLVGPVPAAVDHVIVRSRSRPDRTSVRVAAPEQVFRVVLPAHFGNRVAIEWRAADGRLLHTVRW